MKPEELDQFFRRKLGEQPLKSPAPGDWSSARKLLKQKRDRRPLVFWWIIGLSAIAVLAFLVSQNREIPTDDVPKIESRPPMANNDHPNQSGNEAKLSLEEESLVSSDPSDLTRIEGISRRENSVEPKPGAGNTARRFFGGETDVKLASSDQAAVGAPTAKVPDLAEQPIDLPVEGEEPITETQPSQSVSLIADLDFHLQYRYPFELVHPDDESPIFRNSKIRKTQYGWTASLLMNPANSVGDPVRGFLAGFVAEYPLATNWTVGLRPSVEVTMNENGYSQFLVQTKYGFTAVNETYGLQATSLQFVRLPLYLGWQHDKHSVEAGLAVAWLLSARGQVQQVQIEGSEVQLLNRFSSGWIETSAMKQLSSNLFFGYKFAINPNMKTGITIFYQPGRIYPGIPGAGTLNGDRKWSMGLQALYYLR